MGILLLALVVALSGASPAEAMLIARRISGPMTNLTHVSEYKFSPDSQYVVYTADPEVDGKVELFCVPAKGGAVIKLNADPEYGGRVNLDYFAITPDSQTVVFMADLDGNGQEGIYSVPITGGQDDTLVSESGSSRGVIAMQLSPLGDRVVYLADLGQDERVELYSAPISGAEHVKLNADLIAGGDVDGFRISPDGARVVYVADQEVDEQFELYGNAAAGGDYVKLSGSMVAWGDIHDYAITANSLKVVFTADRLVHGKIEVFSNLVAGGGLYKLSGDTIAAGDYAQAIALAPNSQMVVYSVFRSSPSGKKDLYSNYLIDTDPPQKLSGPDPVSLGHFAIAPNSLRVVFVADGTTEGVMELFSNLIVGGAALEKLNDPPPANGDVIDFAISPNSVAVAYRQSQDVASGIDLYLSATNGQGTPVELSTLPATGNVEEFAFTPNSLGVVYTADQQTDDVDELYLTLGLTPVRLSLPIAQPAGDVMGFKISPNSQVVVYHVDQEVDARFELYAAFDGFGIFMPVIVR
jgi:Tol biopolymer transport system component